MSEIIERREQARNINARVDKLEETLNSFVPQTTAERDLTVEETLRRLQTQLDEIKEKTVSVDLVETLKAVEALKEGFQAEKKRTYNLRNRVSQLEDMVNSITGEKRKDPATETSTEKQIEKDSARPKSCLEWLQLGYTTSGVYSVYAGDREREQAIQVWIHSYTINTSASHRTITIALHECGR